MAPLAPGVWCKPANVADWSALLGQARALGILANDADNYSYKGFAWLWCIAVSGGKLKVGPLSHTGSLHAIRPDFGTRMEPAEFLAAMQEYAADPSAWPPDEEPMYIAGRKQPTMKPNFDGGVSLAAMREVEDVLPVLLQDRGRWRSLLIDYHPPTVRRLWTEHLGFRVHLHRILSTDKPCLLHKHRWPSVIKQVAGCYEMGIAYSADELGPDDPAPPMLATLVLSAGSYYEMTQTDALHYVRPLTDTTLSIMLTKGLYPEASFRKEAEHPPLAELAEAEVSRIIESFKLHYKQ